MGYVDSGSLADKLKDGPLPPRDAAEYVKKVADAVAYAHDNGVIHRDLKPSNVLLDENNEPKVTDFGLAKRVEGDSGLTATGQILGTPSYMPPEQASGNTDDVNESVDVYALGAVLFTLLTGRPPFQAANPVDTLLQVLDAEPLSPRQLNPAVLVDLETICLKCLEKDRRHRYGTAQKLAEELRRFLDGLPIEARPINAFSRGWRWCKRNPVLAGLCATLVITLITGILVASSLAIVATNNAQLAKNRANTIDEKNAELNTTLDDLGRTNAALRGAMAEVEAEQQRTEKQKGIAEWRLYCNEIALASREWREGNPGYAGEVLDHTQASLRGWEYRYLLALFGRSQTTLKGHTDAILSVAFSPDGQRIASGSMDKSLKVWDAETAQVSLTLDGHGEYVTSVAFGPLGKHIVSGGYDGTLKMWDVESGEEVFSHRGHTESINSIVFSRDGERIVTGASDKMIKVWDADVFRPSVSIQGHAEQVNSVDLGPGDLRIVSASSDRTARLWDIESGEEVLAIRNSNPVSTVAFCPDGQARRGRQYGRFDQCV